MAQDLDRQWRQGEIDVFFEAHDRLRDGYAALARNMFKIVPTNKQDTPDVMRSRAKAYLWHLTYSGSVYDWW